MSTKLGTTGLKVTTTAIACLVLAMLVWQWPLFYETLIKAVPSLDRGPRTTDHLIDLEGCEVAPYTVQILSYDPLMMYLENFVTTSEREHLLGLGRPQYQQSIVAGSGDKPRYAEFRTSSTAVLPKDDPTVQCIMARAARFQGFTPISDLEDLQLTHYEGGQQFKIHYDWFSHLPNRTMDRITTFFVMLEADCHHCGTQFTRLQYDWSSEDSRWCEWIDCEQSKITIKPIVGNAVFWRNLLSNGSGDSRTAHAGLPVSEGGFKTGLNIWTQTKVA